MCLERQQHFTYQKSDKALFLEQTAMTLAQLPIDVWDWKEQGQERQDLFNGNGTAWGKMVFRFDDDPGHNIKSKLLIV